MRDIGKKYVSTAPGKIILCGEYSVLEGFPALVMATDRKFKTEIRTRANNTAKPGVKIVARGLIDESYFLPWDDCGNLVYDPGSPLAMMAQTINLLLTECDTENLFKHRDWEIFSDSSELFEQQSKLGLGSSAALSVAVAGLLFEVCAKALPEKERLWALLQNIHSITQGKRGSGVDLAASIAGGCQQFINIDDQKVTITKCSLHNDLHFVFLWSGQSASTPTFLHSLSEWKEKNLSEFNLFMKTLGACSSDVCKSHDAQSFLENLDLFSRNLNEFDQAAGLGIFSGGHNVLYNNASKYDEVVYKSCGAGGGDLGVAVSQDFEALHHFTINAEQSGFARVNISLSEDGLAVRSNMPS